MRKKFLLLSMVFMGITSTINAQTEAVSQPEANPTTNTPTPITVGGIKLEGFVDVYYQSNFGYNNNNVINGGLNPYSDSFELGDINLKFSKDLEKVGFVAQLGFGPRAELANYNSPNTQLIIQQAYVYYKPLSQLTLTAGNFSTYVGYEVIDAPKNFHYSVSDIFQNGPFYHLGIKADYDLGKGFGIMLGMFNQTDRKSNATSGNRNYNFGTQLKYNSGNFNAYLNYIGGQNNLFAVAGDANPMRNQIDLVLDYKMDKIYLALNPSYVTYNPAGASPVSWYGGALYTQYTVSDTFAVGLRSEYIENKDLIPLFTGVGDEEMWTLTLSTPIKLIENFRLVPEFKLDKTKNDVFTDGAGKPTNSQYVLGLAAMYSF